MIGRRTFITLLGGATTWPLAARAQQPERMRRIGVLTGLAEIDPDAQSEISAFRQGLQRLGWTGRNARIVYRWGNGEVDRIRTFARELIALQPDAVLAVSTAAVRALMGETRTVPIVFVRVPDPLGDGLVDNVAKPGGNVTGFSVLEPSIAGKWLQLLKEIAPGVTRVAVMFNPATAPQTKFFMNSIEFGARTLGVKVVAAPVQNAAEIEPAVARLAQPNGGVIVPTDTFMTANRKEFVQATARYRIPAIMADPGSVREGVLMSYYAEINDQYRQAGVYVDRILRGMKPGDLSVQAPTKFTLSINLKTARDLGIEVPLSLLLIADEQVE